MGYKKMLVSWVVGFVLFTCIFNINRAIARFPLGVSVFVCLCLCMWVSLCRTRLVTLVHGPRVGEQRVMDLRFKYNPEEGREHSN